MGYPSIGNQKRGKDAPLGRTGSKFRPCEGNEATSLVPAAAGCTEYRSLAILWLQEVHGEGLLGRRGLACEETCLGKIVGSNFGAGGWGGGGDAVSTSVSDVYPLFGVFDFTRLMYFVGRSCRFWSW